MDNYNCDRCGYQTYKKYLLIKHLKRKNLCSPIINNVLPKDIINVLKQEYKYKCIYCDKKYLNRISKFRHQKKCKELQSSETTDTNDIKIDEEPIENSNSINIFNQNDKIKESINDLNLKIVYEKAKLEYNELHLKNIKLENEIKTINNNSVQVNSNYELECDNDSEIESGSGNIIDDIDFNDKDINKVLLKIINRDKDYFI